MNDNTTKVVILAMIIAGLVALAYFNSEESFCPHCGKARAFKESPAP